MNIILYPSLDSWDTLCQRPVANNLEIAKQVQVIIDRVKIDGDVAVKYYTEQFDGVIVEHSAVLQQEIDKSVDFIAIDLKNAIDVARNNIESFHRSQCIAEPVVETMKGVQCWRENRAIDSVGLYIPGGSAPLFSTLLMLAIPALISGCKRIVLCTPCNKDAEVHAAILYVAKLLGIKEIYKIGGAQAIAAMAFGTSDCAPVNKIFGPGNAYVTQAKLLVQQMGVAIDMPAGPSEVLIIADHTAVPEFVAADLLSQAEHGIDSQVMLVTTTQSLVDQVMLCIKSQLTLLPRKTIAAEALKSSYAIVLPTIKDCIAFSNYYAPEHLILAVTDAVCYIDAITNAGSVFLGHYTPESAGDYASGTNHTLPTYGYAKSYSGVSVDSFLKKITFQKITPKGLQNLGGTIETMAAAEGLMAHKNAVTIRLNRYKNSIYDQ
jgi:histidinol dehydrogenase